MSDRATIDHISFDGSTALVVVDVQNDFTDPAGNLYVRDGERIVPLVNELTARARRAGALVVFTQDWHPEETPHFEPHGGPWPVHCVAGTWGAELHPDLDAEGDVVRKGVGGEDGYSAFSVEDVATGVRKATGLRELLEQRSVERVVLVGLAEDVCVKETALDAIRAGYATEVVLAATRPVDAQRGTAERARQEMQAAGVELR